MINRIHPMYNHYRGLHHRPIKLILFYLELSNQIFPIKRNLLAIYVYVHVKMCILFVYKLYKVFLLGAFKYVCADVGSAC